ncbi:hypothetical protein [Pseudomonas jessenii]|uniref:hypothetical protein n=2 Tax=Pseudomonas TaxID=286 RepID=UPI0030C12D86
MYRSRIVSDAISFGAKILDIENHEFISVSGENLGRCQYSIGSYRVMTHRSAKVVTAYRGSVKKQIKLISGYEMFWRNNGLLTIIQVASPQWTGWLAQRMALKKSSKDRDLV